MIAELCVAMAMTVCPDVSYTSSALESYYAKADLYRSGKIEIVINRYHFNTLKRKRQRQVLIHELTHAKLYQKGDITHGHNKTFKKLCRNHSGGRACNY